MLDGPLTETVKGGPGRRLRTAGSGGEAGGPATFSL